MPAKKLPAVNTQTQPIPEQTNTIVPTPQITDRQMQAPPAGLTQNQVQFGNDVIELKATKLKYQRDRTAAFYHILKQMPLVDILALDDGTLDSERSSDKMLFDWLIAVTDNPKIVTKNYDLITSDTVQQMLKIFCRLNHINQRQQQRKNRQAQERNP